MRNHERKYPRVKSATQLKPIYTRSFTTSPFPMGSQIILDKKRAVEGKIHQIIWKQGAQFGAVGDQCDYINHAELFELAEKGYIKLTHI